MISKSNRPYLIRAIWEWCSDNGYTPYLAVRVDEHTRVPPEYVKSGEIILNLSADATHRLTLGNDGIQFSARFSGVSRECSVPISAVRGIFARENGEGLFFDGPEEAGAEAAARSVPAADETEGLPAETPPAPASPPAGGASGVRKSHLQIVK